MKNRKLLEGLEKEAVSLIEAFVEDGGAEVPVTVRQWVSPLEVDKLAEALGCLKVWDEEARLCVDFLMQLGGVYGSYKFLTKWFGPHEDDVIGVVEEMRYQPDLSAMAEAILGSYYFESELADEPTEKAPFVSSYWNFAWNHLDFSKLIPIRKYIATALGRWHPEVFVELFTNDPSGAEKMLYDNFACEVFRETDEVDELIVRCVEKCLVENQPATNSWSSGPSDRCRAFFQLCELSKLRDGKYHDLVMKLAVMPEFSSSERGVDLLLRHRPEVAMETITAGIGRHTSWRCSDAHRKLFELAMENFNGEGGALLSAILVNGSFRYGLATEVMDVMLRDPDHGEAEVIRKMFLEQVEGLSGKKLADFWAEISEHDRGLFYPEWRTMAKGKSKLMRETAAAWLLANQGEEQLATTESLLASSKLEDRLGGVALLGSSATEKDLARLVELHKSESTKQVRVTIATILSKHGIKVAAEPEKQVDDVEDLAAFEISLAKRAKSVRLPKAPWLDVGSLPPLFSNDGTQLSDLALTHIFQLQARGKGGEIVPEVEVLLLHLDRTRNAAFAHALLDQWFASDMKAPTRWGLDVAGITGDDSIIERLIAPIPEWCAKNHASRGQWAVHAIALLGTETSLGVLDGLIQKYRSRRKYIGTAAALAIGTAAKLLGISDDELAERIVPDFGFGPDGRREFAAKQGLITAVIDPSFKILNIDPESGESTKIPTGKLAEEAAADLKEVTKFLRESVKRQSARLENSMVSARRWEIETWRARFESHPVFRIFAMRLIWGVYDAQGNLIRTFRLFPNGLTAAANGDLEEFSKPASSIGLVHGLELEEKVIREWSARLRRFKVKPVFKQLNRPVHRLDPLHRNRKELQQTAGISISAGNLRAELLGRGWSIGSTGDGGWVACMFKKFPAANVDVYLPVNELHAATGKDEPVTLESAFFAEGATGKHSYLDRMGETETLTFGDIPSIVYSETVADLEALTNS